jgi:hypothetical protein
MKALVSHEILIDLALDSVRDRAFAADDRRGRRRTVPKLPRRLKKAFRKAFQASSGPVATYDGAPVQAPRNHREQQQAWLMAWVAGRNDYEVYGPLVRDGVSQMLEIEDRRIMDSLLRSCPGYLGSGLVYATETDLRELLAKSYLPEIKVVDNDLFEK